MVMDFEPTPIPSKEGSGAKNPSLPKATLGCRQAAVTRLSMLERISYAR